jgi:hypothetical protein
MAPAPVRTTHAAGFTRSTDLVPTRFRATHAALGMFVVLRDEHGVTQMCSQMDHLGEDQWELTLRLPPEQYRYRYYAVHERVTTYVSPRDVETEPVQMCGLDGILTVPASVRNVE